MNELKLELKLLLKKGMSQQEAFKFYDKLEPVSNKEMLGRWRGKEVSSGHPMDGILTICPWYGKEFIDEETVHPLVFKERKGNLFFINPDRIFKYYDIVLKSKMLKKILNSKKTVNRHQYDCILKRFKTKRSKARLRQVEYRGKVSAAMVYDSLPIIDVFRKIDDYTLLGVMDMKGNFNDLGYFFILKREG
ncbi:GXWXG protein [Natranaerovirga pectinivora]|uniref:GXWXG protein n=1 Tax=Natranaerovirga pectinivora TaxID=682400 RepID=A0A4R3MT62_9FIRM|nr:DUF4334 domain-containing protein [Natranaerovirga pectinivora]TCT16234.1 GXWXG protein [Natranaerovirga pectinivora]